MHRNVKTFTNKSEKYASYAYDMYGNLVNEQNEYGYKHNYEYDVYGNQTSYTKPDGTTTGMVYDANNNQIRKGDATFAYNQRGQVIRASNPQGDVTYTYNAFDQMTQVKDTKGNVVSYTYNKDKEISGIVYPNKSVVNYTYNDNNLLASITKNDATIASYTYTARGDVASLTQGNIVSTYAYDDAGRKIAQDTTKGSTPVYQATYGFDANDNLVREVINGKENTYTYNDAQELEESKKYVGDELITTSYTYDLFGNKRVTSSKTGTTTYKYNNKNQLESVEATSGSTSYTYDNNGNLKNKIKADGSNEVYQYDGFDRLIQMKQGAFIYDYRYDAQDERIEQVKTDVRDYPSKAWYDAYYSDYTSKPQKVKRDDMDTTFKLLQEQVDKRKLNGNTCQEESGSSYQLKKQRDTTYKKKPEVTSYTVDRNLEYSEVILSNQQESVYSRGNGLLEENKETQVVGLNNTIVASTKGEEVQNVSYTDYGQNDKIAVGHSYNGELQEDTGLIYLRARYYDPEVGSFIQIDNNYAGEQEEVATQNRYAYALNNPYKYIDRDGEKAKSGKANIGALTTNIKKKTKKKAAIPKIVRTTHVVDVGGLSNTGIPAWDAIMGLIQLFGMILQYGPEIPKIVNSITDGMSAAFDAACDWLGKLPRNSTKYTDSKEYRLAVNAYDLATSAGGISLVEKDKNKDKSKDKAVAGGMANPLPPLPPKKPEKPEKDKDKDIENRLPSDKSQTDHIFDNRTGHFNDTATNRSLLENVSNDSTNYLGIDQHGNHVYSQMQSDGSQVWVYTRNGIIQNGGHNIGDFIRKWVEGIGLIK